MEKRRYLQSLDWMWALKWSEKMKNYYISVVVWIFLAFSLVLKNDKVWHNKALALNEQGENLLRHVIQRRHFFEKYLKILLELCVEDVVGRGRGGCEELTVLRCCSCFYSLEI